MMPQRVARAGLWCRAGTGLVVFRPSTAALLSHPCSFPCPVSCFADSFITTLLESSLLLSQWFKEQVKTTSSSCQCPKLEGCAQGCSCVCLEHLELPLTPGSILWDKVRVRKGGCSRRLVTVIDSRGENVNFWVRRLCPSPVCPCHPKAQGFIGSESFTAKPLPWEVLGLGLKPA